MQLLLQVVEGCCRDRCYGFASNWELQRECNLSHSRVRVLLKQLEDEGAILRVTTAGKLVRLGFVLRLRHDPDLPVATTEEEVQAAISALQDRSKRAAKTSSLGPFQRAEVSAHQRAEVSAHQRAEVSAHHSIKESLSKDERKDKDGRESIPEESPLVQRQRLQTTVAPAVVELEPATPPAPVIAELVPVVVPAVAMAELVPIPAAGPATSPEGLTAAQGSFLGALTPAQRVKWDSLRPAAREQYLGALRLGHDPIVHREVMLKLNAQAAPAAPPPSLTAVDLLRLLPGHGPALVPRCAAAVLQTLGDKTRSWRYLEQLCREVTAGMRSVESLVVPLEKTLAEMERGKRFEKGPAAYWNRCVQNFDREQSPVVRA